MLEGDSMAGWGQAGLAPGLLPVFRSANLERVSQLWHFGLSHSLLGDGVLCVVGCLAAPCPLPAKL